MSISTPPRAPRPPNANSVPAVASTIPYLSPGRDGGDDNDPDEPEPDENTRRKRFARDQREMAAFRRTGFSETAPLYNPIAFALEPGPENLRNLDEGTVVFVDLNDATLYDRDEFFTPAALASTRKVLNKRNLDFEESALGKSIIEPLGSGSSGVVYPACIANLNVRALDDLNLSIQDSRDDSLALVPDTAKMPVLEALGTLRSSRSCLYVLKITKDSVSREAALASAAARIGVGPSFTRSFMLAFHGQSAQEQEKNKKNTNKNKDDRVPAKPPAPIELSEVAMMMMPPPSDLEDPMEELMFPPPSPPPPPVATVVLHPACQVQGALLQRRQGDHLASVVTSGRLERMPGWAVQRIALDAVRCLEQMATHHFFHGDLHPENCVVNLDVNGNYLRGETRAFSVIDLGRAVQADFEAICFEEELVARIPWPDPFVRRYVPKPPLDPPTGATIEEVEAKYKRARAERPRIIFWSPRHNFLDGAVLLHRLYQLYRGMRGSPSRKNLQIIMEAVTQHLRGWHGIPMTNLLDLEDLDLTMQVVAPLNGDVAMAWHAVLKKDPKKIKRLLPPSMFLPYVMGLQTLLAVVGQPLADVAIVDPSRYFTIQETDELSDEGQADEEE